MITVKRTPGGYGSNWICDNVVAGCELDVLRPAGTFTPRDLAADLLLIAAGSGITPVLSILKSALRAGADRVALVYANKDERSVIFAAQLDELVDRHRSRLRVIHWLESVRGLPTTAGLHDVLAELAPRDTYVCGPQPFMDAAIAALRAAGTADERIHVERFFTIDSDPFAEIGIDLDDDGGARTATVTVTLDGETREISWPRTIHLLDVLLASGLDAPFSCRAGQCSACTCRVLAGSVRLDNNEVLTSDDLDDGYVLACQALPTSDAVSVSYDE